MRLYFHTNLDEAQRDVAELSLRNLESERVPIPRKGERVRFTFDGDKNYDLEVVAVHYLFDASAPTVRIELHMPGYYGTQTIAEWTTWFNKHRYGREL